MGSLNIPLWRPGEVNPFAGLAEFIQSSQKNQADLEGKRIENAFRGPLTEAIIAAKQTYAMGGGKGGESVNGLLSADSDQLNPYYQSVADAVLNNKSLYKDLTPSVKQIIAPYIQSQGFTAFGPGLTDTQQTQLSGFDDMLGKASTMSQLIDQGAQTGPYDQFKGSVFGPATGSYAEEVDIGSIISDLQSQLLKLRSGAAVTPQEYVRIRGFIPLASDQEPTVKVKLKRFNEEMQRARQNYEKRVGQTVGEVQSDVKDFGIEESEAPSKTAKSSSNKRWVYNPETGQLEAP